MGKNYFEMIRDGILVDGSGGGDAPAPVLITKSVTANGTYSASDDSADGYSQVSVSVPNSYSAGDEGKVVSNGALVSQTATTATTNGTIDTTTNNSVVVNVANSYSAADEGKVVSNGALVSQGANSVTENGTVDTTLISSLLVNVQGGVGGDFSKLTPVNPSDLDTDNVFIFIPENSSYGFIFGSLVVKNTVSSVQLNFPDQFPINKIGTSFRGSVYGDSYLGKLTCTKGSSYISLSATTTSSGSYVWFSENSPYILIAAFNVVT